MKADEPSVVTVSLTPSEPLEVGRLVASILEAFPGSRITQRDYWQRRIDECEANLTAYEARTGDKIDRIACESLRREYRVAQSIVVPLSGGFSLEGYVGPEPLLLEARCVRPNETLGAVVRFLRSQSVGRVVVWPDAEGEDAPLHQ
jgi:hypothetical protein